MLWYFDLFSQKSWFSKTNNCSFCNKTTQDFAEFWEIWVNFKAKTKTEDEGILKKGKRSSSWFFSLHIGLAGREENQIFCYAKPPNVGSFSLDLTITLIQLNVYDCMIRVCQYAKGFLIRWSSSGIVGTLILK